MKGGVVRDSWIELGWTLALPTRMTKSSPFRYFRKSPEIFLLEKMTFVRFPPSLRNIEHLLHEGGIEISHETLRLWRYRFGPMFAAEIRKRRTRGMKSSH